MTTLKVVVLGAGYVGLVTGLCLAKLGHYVEIADVQAARIERLCRGEAPFYEPGLQELLGECLAAGTVRFSHGLRYRLDAEVALIAVGTPALPNGAADVSAVFTATSELAELLPKGSIIAIKSTVPIGTARKIREVLRRSKRSDLGVASVPEFLREGSALHDVFNPSRTVIGLDDERWRDILLELHEGLNAPCVITNTVTAEMIKYASNAFLATKISFINEIANVCARVGADVSQVAAAMGLDPRIGPHFLQAGLGYGGSCFPKDTRALTTMADELGYEFLLLKAVVEVNSRQRRLPLSFIEETLGTLDGKIVALLGVSFKPNTDDVRESPALDLYKAFRERGAHVRLCDPVVKTVYPFLEEDVRVEGDPYVVLSGAHAAVLVTEWHQFIELDWARAVRSMQQPIIFDGRNALDADELARQGAIVANVGRLVGVFA